MEIIFGKITKLILSPPHVRISKQEEYLASKNRKVKEIPPSPFYDGKYHPPIKM
jgi:hypothetical protein